jgi:Flp pilus assembly protein, ATPase CpaF
MFGRKSLSDAEHAIAAVQEDALRDEPETQTTAPPPRQAVEPSPPLKAEKSDQYYLLKKDVFSALIATIDVAALSSMDIEQARKEIGAIVNDIVAAKKAGISMAEQNALLRDICDDILGYGPLEPLLARDDIADIMVNGANQVFIEVGGKVEETGVRFRDNEQLVSICQRIVSKVGRRVDESSPICDARLADGSRVNVIVPPLAIDGPSLTIRKFKKEKLNLDQLVRFARSRPRAQRSSRSLAGFAATC